MTNNWKKKGDAITNETNNKNRKIIKIQAPYVVVGFEVWTPPGTAFVNLVHNIDKSNGGHYGHAFFYLVEKEKIVRLFSFGPAGLGKTGWFDLGTQLAIANKGAVIKDGRADTRPSTANYPIDEDTKLFRVDITSGQANKLKTAIDKFAKDIKEEKEPYTVWINDTCAETARDLLIKANIKTPEGSGKVKAPKIGEIPLITMVNPYMWHHNFLYSKNPTYRKAFLGPMKRKWSEAQSKQIQDPAFSAWKKGEGKKR